MDIFSSFLVGKSFQSYIMSHREVTLVALSRITPTTDNLDTLRASCREWLMKKEEHGRHWEDYLADTIAVKLLEGTNEIRNACWTYVFTGEPVQNNANGKFDVARSLSGLAESGTSYMHRMKVARLHLNIETTLYHPYKAYPTYY